MRQYSGSFATHTLCRNNKQVWPYKGRKPTQRRSATRNQLRKNFEKSIGREEYTLTENEKVKIVTLSSQEHFYYITMDKETPTNELMKIIDDVKRLVRK
jgi:hypothetical protein